jgi:MerR family transcriptional regulator, light-induced transcriptional regulator
MEDGANIAAELRSLAGELAEDTVARDYQRRADWLSRFGERGRALYLQDTKYHLSYLADALAYHRTSILADYLRWVTEVLTTRGVPPSELRINLECLRETLSDRFGAERAQPMLEMLDDAVTSSRNNTDGLSGESAPPGGIAHTYLDLLLSGNRQVALQLIEDALRTGMSLGEIWLKVFQESQYEIGRRWQANKLSIAQEHYCTAATQLIMSKLSNRLFAGSRNGRSIVSACACGELHEIGLRIVTDFFEIEGWDTYNLGANVPPSSLAEFVEQYRPDVVGLSASMQFHFGSIREMIAALRAATVDNPVSILLGGRAFNGAPDLWREFGAEACACDAEDAVKTANRLVGLAS